MTEPAAPLVSVVVPFVSRHRHLEACVEGLRRQLEIGGPVEIILVDNGSAGGVPEVIAGDPAWVVLQEETPGAYAARNAGIRRARAPIIAFTDADCVADADWLRAIVAAMRDPATAIVVGHCRYPADASVALRLLGAYENAKAEYVLARPAPSAHFAYANNMAVRRSVFDELGPFREWARAADTELVHRLASRRADLRTVFCPAMRVTHLEFLRVRDRIGRMALYTRTNAQVASFRELRARERLGVLELMVRRAFVDAREAGR